MNAMAWHDLEDEAIDTGCDSRLDRRFFWILLEIKAEINYDIWRGSVDRVLMNISHSNVFKKIR